MRSALLLSLLVAGCGGDPPPCSDEACEAWCDEHQVMEESALQGEALRTSRVLSDLEHRLVDERLFALRQGPRLAGDRGLVLCSGTTRCDAPVAREDLDRLAAGTYVLHAEVQVPPDGQWTLRYERRCSWPGPDGTRLSDETVETFPLTHQAGGRPYVIEVLEGFVSPVPGTESRRCHVDVFAEQPEDRLLGAVEFSRPPRD